MSVGTAWYFFAFLISLLHPLKSHSFFPLPFTLVIINNLPFIILPSLVQKRQM